MQILNFDSLEDSDLVYELNKYYPIYFNLKYAKFYKEYFKKEIKLVTSECNQILMPISFSRSKFFISIEVLYPPLKNRGRLETIEEFIFLEKFVCFVKKNKLGHRIITPLSHSIFQAVPSNSIHGPFGTYYLDLKQNDENELFRNLHPKHRNVIRNAINKEVIVKYGRDQIKIFYELHNKTFLRSKMSTQNIDYFYKLYDFMGEESALCGVVYYNEAPIGCFFQIYSSYSSYYIEGGSDDNIIITGALNYLHWDAILKFKRLGVNYYNFVGARLTNVSGTKLEGIQKFKSRFGSLQQRGFLWKKDVNKFICCTFDILLFLKFFLKFGAVNRNLDKIDQELKKIRISK